MLQQVVLDPDMGISTTPKLYYYYYCYYCYHYYCYCYCYYYYYYYYYYRTTPVSYTHLTLPTKA